VPEQSLSLVVSGRDCSGSVRLDRFRGAAYLAGVPALKKRLGVAGLTFYGVGMIVGAGVYSVIGAAAGSAGGGIWVSFALGAFVACLTALSYAELSTMFPRAGAEYAYAKEAFPRARVVSFVLGILLTLAAAGTAATVSLAFAGYLAALVPVPQVPVALGLVALLTLVNVLDLSFSNKVNVVFTLVEVGGLVAFVVVGAAHGDLAGAKPTAPIAGVLTGAALLFFAYLGFEDIVNLAEETEEPSRTLPRAIFISVAVTAVLYVAVGLAAVSLLPAAELAASDAPLSTAARSAAPRVADALALVALFATANTALITLLAGSRLVYGMARDGDAPPALGKVASARGAPWVAVVALGGLAASLVPLGDVGAVAGLSSFAALIAFVTVNLCLVVLRYRAPSKRRPFRVPLSIGRFPLVPAAALASAGLLLLHFDRDVYLGGGIAVVAAFALFGLDAILRRRRSRRSR
jgi:APA family basic amino acid/polyamine antiporter